MKLKIDLRHDGPAHIRWAIACLQSILPELEAKQAAIEAARERFFSGALQQEPEQAAQATVTVTPATTTETPPPAVQATVAPEDNPEAGVPSLDELREVVNRKIAEGHRETVIATVKGYAAKGVPHVPADKRAELIATLESL